MISPILDDTRDDALASTTTASNWASWVGMTIVSRPRGTNSRVSLRRYRRSFTDSLASRTKSTRLRKTRIRTSACGSSTSNCGLGIRSWSSWLELVTGAMSRGGRDPELGGAFISICEQQQMIDSSAAARPATANKAHWYRRSSSHKRSLEDEEEEVVQEGQ